MGAHRFQQLETGQPRHDHVADDEVELEVLEEDERALGAVGAGHLVPCGLEDLHHEHADHILVVDHEDPAHRSTSSSQSGSRSVNSEPRPVSDWTVSAPP